MILGHQPYSNVTVKVFVWQKKKKEKKRFMFLKSLGKVGDTHQLKFSHCPMLFKKASE